MKKIISVLAILIMLLSNVFAITVDDAADTLVKMNLMSGYPDGTLGLEKYITRAEFCTLIAKMLGINNQESFLVDDFEDLQSHHWAYKSVIALADKGVISGYQDHTFRPSSTLTYAECASILIGVLEYKNELEGVWPTNVMSMAESLQLNKDLIIEKHSDKMTRGYVSIMLINALNVEMKN